MVGGQREIWFEKMFGGNWLEILYWLTSKNEKAIVWSNGICIDFCPILRLINKLK